MDSVRRARAIGAGMAVHYTTRESGNLEQGSSVPTTGMPDAPFSALPCADCRGETRELVAPDDVAPRRSPCAGEERDRPKPCDSDLHRGPLLSGLPFGFLHFAHHARTRDAFGLVELPELTLTFGG